MSGPLFYRRVTREHIVHINVSTRVNCPFATGYRTAIGRTEANPVENWTVGHTVKKVTTPNPIGRFVNEIGPPRRHGDHARTTVRLLCVRLAATGVLYCRHRIQLNISPLVKVTANHRGTAYYHMRELRDRLIHQCHQTCRIPSSSAGRPSAVHAAQSRATGTTKQ